MPYADTASSELRADTLFSMEALHRAWRMVRKNGQSPGTDRITPGQFEQHLERELRQLREELLSSNYHPQPVQRYYQVKPSGKKRPLTIWAVRDRVAQRVILEYLTPICEEFFLSCSYGFRPGRQIADAVRAVAMAHKQNLRWVVDADISDCFSNVNADLLMAQVRWVDPAPVITWLIDLWLNTPVAGRSRERALVSQGGVISPLLTNLYLHRFDQAIVRALPEARLVRFADDFVIFCRRKREAVSALSTARQALGSLKMRVNEAKTQIVHFDVGFTFLGVTFKGSHHSALPGKED